MQITINGHTLEGTPAEIHEYVQRLTPAPEPPAAPKPDPVATAPAPPRGDGRHPSWWSLTPPIRDTYEALELIGVPTRVEQVAEILETSKPAATYRLARLLDLGMIARTEHGVYQIAEAAQ